MRSRRSRQSVAHFEALAARIDRHSSLCRTMSLPVASSVSMMSAGYSMTMSTMLEPQHPVFIAESPGKQMVARAREHRPPAHLQVMRVPRLSRRQVKPEVFPEKLNSAKAALQLADPFLAGSRTAIGAVALN